jgi:hypothetical protein
MLDIGQKVVCVNDEFDDWVKKLYTALPIKDKTYFIRDIRLGVGFEKGNKVGKASVLLNEIVNPPAKSKSALEMGFDSERFVPLLKLITSHLPLLKDK